MKIQLNRNTAAGYTTVELLLFMVAIVGIVLWNWKPIQTELEKMHQTRTEAAQAEINYQKQRYLFESKTEKIQEFNRASDQTRWEILSPRITRGGELVATPDAFIASSGKSTIVIGADSQDVELLP